MVGPDLVIHHPKSLLDAMGPWCTDHHTASGLVAQVLSSDVSMADAEVAIMQFIARNTTPGQRLVLAGNSVYVDRYFLEKDMPRLARLLDPTILDCSALSEFIRRFNYPIYDMAPPKGGNLHRALDDIRNSVEEFRYYQNSAFERQISQREKRSPRQDDVTFYLMWIDIIGTNIHGILTDGTLNELAETKEGKTSEELIEFLRRNKVRSERLVPVAGRCLGPLRTRLKQLAVEFNEYCHYRSVDVDVLSLVCEHLFPEIYQRRPISTAEHDLRHSIELLRFYRSTIFK